MSNDSSIQASRPTLNINGQDNPSLSDGLLSLFVVENTDGLYRCEALFGNWGSVNNDTSFLYFDRRVLDFGKPFKVKLGADAASTIFDGRIMALEAEFPNGRAPALRVLAEDRCQDLRMTRRTRSFAEVTDADVMRQIASEHGMTPKVDVTGPSHRVLVQVNQSNLAFLRERARAIEAELWVDGATLAVKQRSARPQDTVRLTYQRELREFTVLADLSNQRTTVTVSGWDVMAKSALKHDASVSLIGGELNGDESGVAILASKLGERKESLAHTVPLTDVEAQAEAESYFKRCARRFVVGRGEAEVDKRLRAGNRVELIGLGPLFSGKYYLSEVRHVFDRKGIRTGFTAERIGLGRG